MITASMARKPKSVKSGPSGNPQAASLDAALRSSTVPAISRAAAILRLLGRSSAPQGVQAIARALGIIPSTCLHILRTLVTEELVSVDPVTKLYTLGPGAVMLAQQWLGRDRFAAAAQPLLDAIAREHGVTAIGVKIVGLEHMIVLAMARTEGMIQLNTQVGSRFPATISATGRCIAAFGDYERDELRRHFRQLRWDNAPTLAEWENQVEQTRSRGYAVDQGQYMNGVTIVAAPVIGAGGSPSHSLVTVGLSGQLPAPAVARIGRELHEQALRLSRTL